MRPSALGGLALLSFSLGALAFSPASAQASAPVSAPAQKVSLDRKLRTPANGVEAANLLALAQQAANLPTEGLDTFYEQVKTIEEGGTTRAATTSEEAWVDLPGQRLKAVSFDEGQLDAVWLLTPKEALVYTESGGTVPIPRQHVQLLRTHLHSGVLGLAMASKPEVRLNHQGHQNWDVSEKMELRGEALEVTFPDGVVWEYLIDPDTGTLVADREMESGLTYFYEARAKDAPAAAEETLGVRGIITDSGEILYREEVLKREFNPTLPSYTFEVQP